jgi:hypothetical protein
MEPDSIFQSDISLTNRYCFVTKKKKKSTIIPFNSMFRAFWVTITVSWESLMLGPRYLSILCIGNYAILSFWIIVEWNPSMTTDVFSSLMRSLLCVHPCAQLNTRKICKDIVLIVRCISCHVSLFSRSNPTIPCFVLATETLTEPAARPGRVRSRNCGQGCGDRRQCGHKEDTERLRKSDGHEAPPARNSPPTPLPAWERTPNCCSFTKSTYTCTRYHFTCAKLLSVLIWRWRSWYLFATFSSRRQRPNLRICTSLFLCVFVCCPCV